MGRRIVVGLAGFVLGVAVLGWAFRGPIVRRLMERTVARNLSTSLLDEVADGLHVVLCGAGSPLPDVDRSGPCVAVIAGPALYVVDAGSGASRSLFRLRLPQGRVQAVFLTHFHSDHIDGLGELMLQRWVGGAHAAPLPVYGPSGVETVVDAFRRAYSQDAAYRVAHHGAEVVPPAGAGGAPRSFAVPLDGEASIVVDHGGLEVTVFRVDHSPVEPAVGYRFAYGGRSVVVSGDTTKSANLQHFARDVDLLVHEALSPELVAVMNRGAARAGAANIEKIMADIVEYHTSPVEAAEVAREAHVRHLLFYHIVPPLPLAPLHELFLAGVSDVYDGPVTLGRDGTFISLPTDSRVITHEDLL